MQFKKFGNKYLLRIDKGEEIVSTIKQFCTDQDIKLGTISGIGATNQVTVGLFNPATKEYLQKELNQDFEISPLLGNITTMNGETYLHLHINLADQNHHCFGGHLNEAYVSATFEAVIESIEGEVDREKSEEIGLNLLKFD
jgi:uncharacterized protein